MRVKSKKLISALLVAVMTLTMAATTGCSSKSSASGKDGVYTFVYAGTVADSHPMAIAMKEAAEAMEAASDGRLIMKVYTNNTLGDSRSNIEQMQVNGTIKMGEVGSAALSSFTDIFKPLQLPFLFTSKEQAFEFFDSKEGKKLDDQSAEEVGVRPLAWFYNDSRTLTNSKHPIETPDDMKGLKIRVQESDLYLKTFTTLGSSPIAMSFAEVFTGLQQGTIDGQDNGVALTVSQKFNEVQSYYTDLHHVIDMAPILVSEEWYQSLPEDLQKILKEEMEQAATRERQLMDEYYEDYMAEIEKTSEITYLTDDQRLAFRDACSSVYDWFYNKYPELNAEELVDYVTNMDTK